MEILDGEEPIIDTKGRNLVIICLLAYFITGIISLVGFYGSWVSFSAFSSKGAPDAMQLSNGIGISGYAQWAMIVPLIIGVICQNIPSSYQHFSKPIYWRFIMIISISALLGSFIPLNFILLIVAIISIIIVSTNKSQYFGNKE